MKILMINVVCGIRSTGRICTDLANALESQGHDVKIAYGRGRVPQQFQRYAIRIGSDIDILIHGLKVRLFDACGFGSKRATKKFVKWVKEYNPDVIHIHNIHGYYININILFNYLRTCGKKIIWTLHDSWAFTGHCSYFDYIGCFNWRSGCKKCPQKKSYPSCYGISFSALNFKRKKEIFSLIPKMTIVTPSEWLAGLVKQTFLNAYQIEIINNGVDINVFTSTPSNILVDYGIEDKKVLLGVASIWDERKGLKYFIELSKILSDDYKIVLIGLSKKQLNNLPPNIIGISHTADVFELVKWYSAATIFINPTLEDNYPTTNLEAISCGTPVITFNTGGSSESAKFYGIAVAEKTLAELLKAISLVSRIEKKQVDLSSERMIREYLSLYRR